ncbi:MAG TPA: zinc ABC transporter substrate-binding protein [Solirubrobacteraceae bacterium]|nr:zinc ABC transporter substrate-binding protein [Solirubrobacteraceae bacterium]
MRPRERKLTAAACTAAVAAVVAGGAWALAGTGPIPHARVVAAESAWGSLVPGAASIVSGPAVDPHDYEPTPADARALANARIVIVNGAGYDRWASRLLSAQPESGRRVVDVAKLAGADGNPHLWYAPRVVDRVARLFGVRVTRYDATVARIRARFAGTPIGASESIVAPLARALGLRVLTPASLLNAVSEGSEPTRGDLDAARRQMRHIRVWVLNTQNVTPEVRRLTAAARSAGVPVVDVTESPDRATFVAWQLHQLNALEQALAG